MIKYEFRPLKKFGQNFLIDYNITTIIVKSLSLQKKEAVLEIGTGLGALTLALIPAVQHVFSFEKDTRLKPILDDLLSPYSNSVTVLYQDILTFDLAHFLSLKKQEGYHIEKLVGNLPYSISLPLLRKIMDMRSLLKIAVVMVQKEVAERMLAKPGSKNYGLLSVMSNYYTRIDKLHLVKPNVFFPKPEVESLLIKIHFLQKPNIKVIDEDLFFDIVRAIFQHRRKSLANALKLYFGKSLEKYMLEKILEEAGINPNQRGETLSLEEYPELTKAIKNIIN
jgi:16S rRNA (adenine1518-N6/adenine1519-N6)-dimethyltransferase